MGQKYGIRNAGYYALRSLRIEKFFAFWGQDLDAFTTPMECGREFQVKLEKVEQKTEIASCSGDCYGAGVGGRAVLNGSLPSKWYQFSNGAVHSA